MVEVNSALFALVFPIQGEPKPSAMQMVIYFFIVFMKPIAYDDGYQKMAKQIRHVFIRALLGWHQAILIYRGGWVIAEKAGTSTTPRGVPQR